MHSKYLTLFAAFVVILVAATALSTTDNVYADKRGEEYSQAQSLVNECELNCVNSAPQNQGDGAVLAPTVSVSGGQNEQGPGGIGEQNEQGPGGIGEQAGSESGITSQAGAWSSSASFAGKPRRSTSNLCCG